MKFAKSIKSILPKGGFARAVALLAGGAALGQAITVLVSPVLTRIYSPEDFGVFGVYASILGIVVVVASLRYEYAILLPDDDETAANIMALCIVIMLGTVSISWFIIQCFGDFIVSWARVPGLGRYLWLIPLGMLGAGTYQILNYWAVRKRNFARIGRTRLFRGVARAVLQVGLGYLITGPLGLLLGQFAGESAGSASLGSAAWKRDSTAIRAISLKGMLDAAVRYRRFPIFSGSSALIDSLGLNTPQILFAAFYGAGVAGWFALGQRVIAAPLNIVVDSVAQVYFGQAARLPKDDPLSMKRFFWKLSSRMALAGALPVAAICALAPLGFVVIFGPGWETAGRYVQILGVMFAIRFAVIPLQHTLNILERQDIILAWDGARLIMVVGAILIVNALGFSDIAAIAAYSLSMSAAYILLWCIVWRELTRRIGSCMGGDLDVGRDI